jgi:hypothetical protein
VAGDAAAAPPTPAPAVLVQQGKTAEEVEREAAERRAKEAEEVRKREEEEQKAREKAAWTAHKTEDGAVRMQVLVLMTYT